MIKGEAECQECISVHVTVNESHGNHCNCSNVGMHVCGVYQLPTTDHYTVP